VAAVTLVAVAATAAALAAGHHMAGCLLAGLPCEVLLAGMGVVAAWQAAAAVLVVLRGLLVPVAAQTGNLQVRKQQQQQQQQPLCCIKSFSLIRYISSRTMQHHDAVPLYVHPCMGLIVLHVVAALLQMLLGAVLHASAELAGSAAALAALQQHCLLAGQLQTGTAGLALAQQQQQQHPPAGK
jgi:hypothetical protein